MRIHRNDIQKIFLSPTKKKKNPSISIPFARKAPIVPSKHQSYKQILRRPRGILHNTHTPDDHYGIKVSPQPPRAQCDIHSKTSQITWPTTSRAKPLVKETSTLDGKISAPPSSHPGPSILPFSRSPSQKLDVSVSLSLVKNSRAHRRRRTREKVFPFGTCTHTQG